MITVNGLEAWASKYQRLSGQKNSHQRHGGCKRVCLEEKLHEDANNRSSCGHPLLSAASVQANLLTKSHIRMFGSLLCKTSLPHKKTAPHIGAARDTRRAPSLRTPPDNSYVMKMSQSALHHLHVDLPDLPRHHASVPFNSGTGIGLPNVLADSRHFAAFFASVTYAIGVSMVSMVGRSGGVLARAGFQDAGRPTLLRACHPDWSRDGGFNTHLGGHHA